MSRRVLLEPGASPTKLGILQVEDQLWAVSPCCTCKLEMLTNPFEWGCSWCRKTIWFPLGMAPTGMSSVLRFEGNWLFSDIFNFVDHWTGWKANEDYTLGIESVDVPF